MHHKVAKRRHKHTHTRPKPLAYMAFLLNEYKTIKRKTKITKLQK